MPSSYNHYVAMYIHCSLPYQFQCEHAVSQEIVLSVSLESTELESLSEQS